MTRVLVLGGDGMLGHQILRTLRSDHEVHVTLHRPIAEYAKFDLFDPALTHDEVDVCLPGRLAEVFQAVRPSQIVNCIGLVKQHASNSDVISNLEVNSLLPHRLAALCQSRGARLIHFSTDCVFSGKQGQYLESDTPDAEDLYGRTKLLGEVVAQGCLTLRTSFIGRELSRRLGLVEWFLSQKASVQGYRRAIFSGLTSGEIARIIKKIVEKYPTASGLYHLSAAPIDKFSLLKLLKERFATKVEIVPDDHVVIDRSLDSSRFRKEFDYEPPSWQKMISDMSEGGRSKNSFVKGA